MRERFLHSLEIVVKKRHEHATMAAAAEGVEDAADAAAIVRAPRLARVVLLTLSAPVDATMLCRLVMLCHHPSMLADGASGPWLSLCVAWEREQSVSLALEAQAKPLAALLVGEKGQFYSASSHPNPDPTSRHFLPCRCTLRERKHARRRTHVAAGCPWCHRPQVHARVDAEITGGS